MYLSVLNLPPTSEFAVSGLLDKCALFTGALLIGDGFSQEVCVSVI